MPTELLWAVCPFAVLYVYVEADVSECAALVSYRHMM